jgi:tRNA pseudouridine13 synthase
MFLIVMIIKKSPEDFIVNEIYDLEEIKTRDLEKEDNGNFFYFELIKTNYEQIRCLRYVAKLFGKNYKDIHFCGTKDKVGITTQLISIRNLKKSNIEKNVEHINNEIKDINIKFIGEFKSRLNLGENVGNKFKIIIREITKIDLEKFNTNLKKFEKNNFQFLNLFESQRFGFGGNNHKVGKYILQNEMKKAIFEILSSTPQNPSEFLEIFLNFIKENEKDLFENHLEKAIELTPRNFENYKVILEELKLRKNDFNGALKTLPKKIQTIFINAYQSYVFNSILKKLNFNDLKIKEIDLISLNSKNIKEIELIENEILENDNLSKESFNLKHIPTLKNDRISKREIYSTITNFNYKFLDKKNEEMLIEFDLKSGEYATNIINQLFL